MYNVQKIGLFNFSGQIKISKILYFCGKDMAQKYDLHHWDNSYLKNMLIILLCELRNVVYLVTDKENNSVATFQVRMKHTDLHLEKLATLPKFSGSGIGSFCIEFIENLAKQYGCKKICLDVYSLSKQAIGFYEHKGYSFCGNATTLKYSIVRMEKILE